MVELLSGTVTLLFSDIEGSTELQRRLGERYQEVVEDHRRLLEDAFTANRGTVVDRQTESFFVAFPRARDAVSAAVQAQRALVGQAWPDGAQVKVRMGIHAGEPEVSGDRYVGLAVSRAARICAAAHGGQVLLSSTARALLADDERQALRPLGAHRLKDFAAPEPISQLVIDGLPSQFPPLRTEARPGRRRRLTVAAAALAVAGGIAAALAVTLTGGSSGLTEIGPTSVGVIDPKTNRLVAEIPLGFKSHLIAAGEGYVWVADPEGSVLVRIDPETREVKTFGIEAGAVPFGLAAGEGSVWVALLKGETQFVLELGAELGERRGREIQFGERALTLNVAGLNPLAVGEDAVWALDLAVGALWRIEPRTGIPSMLAGNLDALSLAAGGGAVWVGGTDVVTRIDAATGLEVGSVTVGSQPIAETSSVALGERGVWFAANVDTRLWKIDPEANAVTETILLGSAGPSGIAVGEEAVWVANGRYGTVLRVGPQGGETTTIAVGPPLGGVVAASGWVWTSAGAAES